MLVINLLMYMCLASEMVEKFLCVSWGSIIFRKYFAFVNLNLSICKQLFTLQIAGKKKQHWKYYYLRSRSHYHYFKCLECRGSLKKWVINMFLKLRQPSLNYCPSCSQKSISCLPGVVHWLVLGTLGAEFFSSRRLHLWKNVVV